MSRADVLEKIRIGTSGWSYGDWVGPFYPPKTAKGDFLPFYAEKFDVVEIDSTFYAVPSSRNVVSWQQRTPDHFRFATKVPGAVTHGARGERPNVEKVLLDPDGELDRYLETIQLLGEKLGPILFQFPYFRVKELSAEEFFARLEATLARLPGELKFAVEVRNRGWLNGRFYALLRAYGAAPVSIDHPYMSAPLAQSKQAEVTSDFSYVRLLGDRYGIEKVTKEWGETVVDKSSRVSEWAQVLRGLAQRGDTRQVFVFANNHFAGHAPATCAALRDALAATHEK